LEFLGWEELSAFSLASKDSHKVRNHSSLDQTRSGTISLGKGVSNAVELMDKVRERQWSHAFRGHRTHLRLYGLTHLSANMMDSIDDDFVNNACPLKEVTSLDCSIPQTGIRRPWLAPYEDYVDKGFAHGLALSLLVPNLRRLDMSYLPLTLAGLAWITENNPLLEVIRWNRSLIWPINSDACEHIKAYQNLKEIYLDDARLLFCEQDMDPEQLWTCFSENNHKLEKISLRGAQWYHHNTYHLTPIPQASLIKFVRCTSSLRWFRSDLTPENIELLKRERPEMTFCS
jgi:hypothetical protein